MTRFFHSFKLSIGYIFLMGGLCSHANAAVEFISTPSPPAMTLEESPIDLSSISLDSEHEITQKHYLHRFNEKRMVSPKILTQKCRYTSLLTTPPPFKRVALTFDDGPEPIQTEYILEILKKYNIQATFFMIGEKMLRYPKLVQAVRDAHQSIGNHTWNHPNFHELGGSEQSEQVLSTEMLLESNAGPKLFRYPYGNSTCGTNNMVHERGYKIIGWHIDSCDWAFGKSGVVTPSEANLCGISPLYTHDYVGHVVSAVMAREGGIVLMHDIHPQEVEQLEAIILRLKAEGYTFGAVLDPEFHLSLR